MNIDIVYNKNLATLFQWRDRAGVFILPKI